jgi:hypothetical protein
LKSAAASWRRRGSDDESWLQTLFFVVDELVCDFLTPGVGGAVTIKSHDGMTSSHTIRVLSSWRRRWERLLHLIFSSYCACVCRTNRPYAHPASQPSIHH